MDKDVKELLDWLEEKDGYNSSLWGMKEVVVEPDSTTDAETPISTADSLLKIFNAEQLRFIQILINNVVNAIEFHNQKDDSVHPDLRETVNKIDAKLRNHRHNLDQTYSAKAEF